MPAAGRSEPTVLRVTGAIVALIAVVGYLGFGWSFDRSGSSTATAIGWTLDSVHSNGGA